MANQIDEMLSQAKKAMELGKKKEAAILLDQAIKIDSTYEPTWRLLHQLVAPNQTLESFKESFTEKYLHSPVAQPPARPATPIPQAPIPVQSPAAAAHPVSEKPPINAPSVAPQSSGRVGQNKNWFQSLTGLFNKNLKFAIPVSIFLVFSCCIVTFLVGKTLFTMLTKDPLLGVWKAYASGETFEFRDDGTVVITLQGETDVLNYKKLNNNYLQLTDPTSGESSSVRFEINDNQLIIENIVFIRSETKPSRAGNYLPKGLTPGIWISAGPPFKNEEAWEAASGYFAYYQLLALKNQPNCLYHNRCRLADDKTLEITLPDQVLGLWVKEASGNTAVLTDLTTGEDLTFQKVAGGQPNADLATGIVGKWSVLSHMGPEGLNTPPMAALEFTSDNRLVQTSYSSSGASDVSEGIYQVGNNQFMLETRYNDGDPYQSTFEVMADFGDVLIVTYDSEYGNYPRIIMVRQ